MGKFDELAKKLIKEEGAAEELNNFLLYNQKEVKVLAKGYGEIEKRDYSSVKKKDA